MLRSAASKSPQGEATLAQMNQLIGPLERQEGAALAAQYQAETQRLALGSTSPRKEMPKRAEVLSVAEARSSGPWRVQLGAFRTPGAAQKLWSQVSSRFPGRQPFFLPSGAVTRLVVGSFRSSGEAERACGAVKPCLAIQG